MSQTTETPQGRARQQRAWNWYDWANSAYVTTTATVLFSPYLQSVAEKDACGFVGTTDAPCQANLHVLGVPISPGSLPLYIVTLSTILSALVLPIVGAAADRSAHKPTLMARYAWAGSVAAGLMFFVAGTDWQLGALLFFLANVMLGASLVVYDSILIDIATPDERDRVSSRGWAWGYLGGGILLALNLAFVTFYESFGIDKAMSVRISLLSAAVWWAAFTFIPYRRIKGHKPTGVVPAEGGLVRASFGQLARTLGSMRAYPITLTFLLAYLFYNDGIQTVIYAASQYGQKQLGFAEEVLIATILLVQFVAFGGALFFGRAAARYGAHRTILGGLVAWVGVVVVGYFLPVGQVAPFIALAVAIGIILGGTQALSRSLFSQLIPRGKEAEYFSLYQAAERGTSWLGTLVFGLVHQWTHSFRPALVTLAVFFIVGGLILTRVKMRQGIIDAGNEVPATV